MKIRIFFLLCFILPVFLNAQMNAFSKPNFKILGVSSEKVEFSSKRIESFEANAFREKEYSLIKRQMTTLLVWSVSNFLVSGYSLAAQSQVPLNASSRSFHQMNIYWNTVNFGIAALSLRGQKKYMNSAIDPDGFVGRNSRFKKTFLLNAGLDVLYMGSGLAAMYMSDRFSEEPLVKGFGSSVFLQGFFLFGFDLLSYFEHKKLRRELNL